MGIVRYKPRRSRKGAGGSLRSSLSKVYAVKGKRMEVASRGSGAMWSSATEMRYFHSILQGRGKYEAEAIVFTPTYFAPKDRHRYTPDYVDVLADGRKVYHEVKGSYSFFSQDGARLRWCMAAMVRPDAIFVWAKETKAHKWNVEVWYDGGRIRMRERNVAGFSFDGNGELSWQR